MKHEDNLEIGKIIGSQSQTHYICEVYRDADRENPPGKQDHEFGQFVYVLDKEMSSNKLHVGVIFNTQIVDPDQGRTGPRHSEPDEQNAFNPGYVDEKRVLKDIAMVGTAELDGETLNEVRHSVPVTSLEVDDVVRKMNKEWLKEFHSDDGELKLEYLENLSNVADDFSSEVTSRILTQLKDLRPDDSETLKVIQQSIEWKAKRRGI